MPFRTRAKPAYQPWNEEEFQADTKVRGMTWLERHLYRALLQGMFWCTTRPYAPNDDDELWVLAGAVNKEMWLDNKSNIMKCLQPVEGNENLLEQKRVTADWKAIMKARARYSRMGQLSAKARSAKVEHTLNTGSTREGKTSGEKEREKRSKGGSSQLSSFSLED